LGAMSNAVGCSSRADNVTVYAAYTAAVTYDAFEWERLPGNPKNCSLPWWRISTPI